MNKQDDHITLMRFDDRFIATLERIALAFEVIAEAMTRDDEGIAPGPARNVIRTMDSDPLPSEQP